MKILLASIMLILFLGIVSAEEYNITVCEGQLKQAVDLYNNCSYDYLQGNNCGTLTDLLKDGNKKLSDNLNSCRQKYWIFLIPAIFIIFLHIWLIIERRRDRKK